MLAACVKRPVERIKQFLVTDAAAVGGLTYNKAGWSLGGSQLPRHWVRTALHSDYPFARSAFHPASVPDGTWQSLRSDPKKPSAASTLVGIVTHLSGPLIDQRLARVSKRYAEAAGVQAHGDSAASITNEPEPAHRVEPTVSVPV